MCVPHAAEDTQHPSATIQTASGRNSCVANLALGKKPIDVHILSKYLLNYREKSTILDGFTFGFKLQYHGPRAYREAKNLKSVYDRPDIARKAINTEVSLGRIGGPFNPHPLFPPCKFHHLALFPKTTVPTV